MTKADLLANALDEFLATSPDVEAAAIVSADGLPMASALPPDVEEDRLAAMSAALLTLGERAADGLGKGDLAQVFVEGKNGYVVLMQAGADAVLVAVTSKNTKVGLVLFEMRRAASTIGRVMDEPAHVPSQERQSQEGQGHEGQSQEGQGQSQEGQGQSQEGQGQSQEGQGQSQDQAFSPSVVAPVGPVRAPEPEPAAETESHIPSWQ